MPEIDQSHLDALTKANALFNSLLEDPKHGLEVKRAIKDMHPEARIRDLDLISQVTAPYDAKFAALEAQNAALQAAIEADKQAREQEKAEGNLTAALAKVRKENDFTDEGMTKVLETMRERNLAHDPEAAAALVKAQMPKTPPTSARSALVPPRVDIYGLQGNKSSEDTFKQLHTQPWAFFEDTCIDVLNEFSQAAE